MGLFDGRGMWFFHWYKTVINTALCMIVCVLICLRGLCKTRGYTYNNIVSLYFVKRVCCVECIALQVRIRL